MRCRYHCLLAAALALRRACFLVNVTVSGKSDKKASEIPLGGNDRCKEQEDPPPPTHTQRRWGRTSPAAVLTRPSCKTQRGPRVRTNPLRQLGPAVTTQSRGGLVQNLLEIIHPNPSRSIQIHLCRSAMGNDPFLTSHQRPQIVAPPLVPAVHAVPLLGPRSFGIDDLYTDTIKYTTHMRYKFL